jgi:hypothetical protein
MRPARLPSRDRLPESANPALPEGLNYFEREQLLVEWLGQNKPFRIVWSNADE